jgi:hypothetical protein
MVRFLLSWSWRLNRRLSWRWMWCLTMTQIWQHVISLPIVYFLNIIIPRSTNPIVGSDGKLIGFYAIQWNPWGFRDSESHRIPLDWIWSDPIVGSTVGSDNRENGVPLLCLILIKLKTAVLGNLTVRSVSNSDYRIRSDSNMIPSHGNQSKAAGFCRLVGSYKIR